MRQHTVNSATPRALTTVEAARFGSVRLQALIFFVYSRVKLRVGHWSYTILTQARRVEPQRAALMVSTYWTCLFVGRVAVGFQVSAAAAGAVTLPSVGGSIAARGGPDATAVFIAMTPLTLTLLHEKLLRRTSP